MNNNVTLYNKIVEYLKDKIAKGEYQPSDKLPTEAELSNLFNVSRITSKRALEELEKQNLIVRKRGSGSFVADRVDEVSPRDSEPVKIINMIIPLEAINVCLLDIIKGASDVLTANGYQLAVENIVSDRNKEREMIRQLRQKEIQGVIYYPIFDVGNLDLLYNLSIQKYPIVTIDKYFSDIDISSVVTDNFGGAYDAVDYLCRLGHKKIAYLAITQLENESSVRQRFFGYCKALYDNGIQYDESLVKVGFDVNTDSDLSQAEQQKKIKAMSDLLLSLLDRGVTAIHTENDNVAIMLINVCNEIGIKIPEQLSVVGFDNLALSGYVSVPLTTISQNFYEIGKRSAEIVLDKIKGDSKECTREYIPSSLVERKSCRKIEA